MVGLSTGVKRIFLGISGIYMGLCDRLLPLLRCMLNYVS
jgi:hypothetical protein